jgi:hypothetical protein
MQTELVFSCSDKTIVTISSFVRGLLSSILNFTFSCIATRCNATALYQASGHILLENRGSSDNEVSVANKRTLQP